MLLKVLAGRGDELENTETAGVVLVDGCKTCKTGTHFESHHGAYIPQDNDHLIGVLTVKEAIAYSLRLHDKSGLDAAGRAKRVDEMIDNMALKSCEDTKIGTFYMAGISGGQKRRCAVACELVHHPKLLCADEPTSGLDTTSAIKCTKYIKSICEQDGSDAGCVMSIHQPNDELLSLFDNIILLVEGKTMFSGSLADAKVYFNGLGVGDYGKATPTEHYLFKMDRLFFRSGDEEEGAVKAIDYEAKFVESPNFSKLIDTVNDYGSNSNKLAPAGKTTASWFAQFSTLLDRNFMVAKRDYALYYLQYNIALWYGLLVGAMFMSLDYKLDDTVTHGFSAIVWVVALQVYIFVFKAFYFAEQYPMYIQEKNNNMYSASASAAAEYLSFALLSPFYCIGWLSLWFTIGYPMEACGYMFLLGYVSNFTAEAIPALVARFTGGNVPLGLIMTQGFMFVLFLFSGGVFIRDSKIPPALEWVKNLSPFEHATDALMGGIWEHVQYHCETGADSAFPNRITGGSSADNTTYQDQHPGQVCETEDGSFAYPCDPTLSDSVHGCNVKGPKVVEIFKNQTPDKWDSLLYLLFLGVGFRAVALFLQMYPPHYIVTKIKLAFKKGAEVEAVALRAAEKDAAKKKAAAPAARASGAAPAARRRGSTFGGSGSLVFRNVKVDVSKSCGGYCGDDKTIIDGISAKAESGRLMALMGPSGAGKTTLLNALAGMAPYAETSADMVLLKGMPFKKEHLGYVPQFDNINPVFTVYETVELAARLRSQQSEDALKATVDDLLATVGLLDFKDVRASKLAGGQLKLVSIAIGLVSRPKVLFLDEPTTGLDSTAAEAVVSAVKEIASTGKIVIMTLHQPSIMVFDHIDDLMLLSNGRLAYFGSVEDAPPCFAEMGCMVKLEPDGKYPESNFTPYATGEPREAVADQLINFVATDPPKADGWDAAFKATNHARPFKDIGFFYEEPAANPSEAPRPSAMTKFTCLTKKFLVTFMREPGAYIYRSMAMLAFGLFVGLLFLHTPREVDALNEITAIAFLWNWSPLYFGLASTPAFCTHRLTSLTAYAGDQHTIWQFCLAQFVASIPFNLIGAVVFMVPLHLLSGVNDTFECFLYGVVNCWLMGLFMDGVMWNVIEAAKSNVLIAVTSGMLVLGFLMIFPGFFIKPDDMQPSMAWIPWIVPTKYGLEGSLYALIHGETYSDPSGQQVHDGDYLLENFFELKGVDDYSPYAWIHSAILFGFVLAVRGQHFYLMYNANKSLGSMDHFNSESLKKPAGWTPPATKVSPAEIIPLLNITPPAAGPAAEAAPLLPANKTFAEITEI